MRGVNYSDKASTKQNPCAVIYENAVTIDSEARQHHHKPVARNNKYSDNAAKHVAGSRDEVVKLTRFCLAITLMVTLSGCIHSTRDTKTIVESQLAYKDVVYYRDITTFPGNVACGNVNSMGPWGEGSGYRRFITRNDRALFGPSGDEWAIFCTNDPASALYSRLGIGPVDSSNPNLLTVQSQLNTLTQALARYLDDNADYPPTTPGLQSLLPSNSNKPGTKIKSYTDSVPEDPWGRPYLYEKPRQLHGGTAKYKLYTLGRDGTEGGSGEDADIGNWNLDYINHVSEL
jgi:type II secretion system protein G